METRKKKIKSFSESVVLGYMSEQAKVQKSSTLWSRYSMLKASLVVNNNVDITKYCKLVAFLKRQSVGYKAKKSKIFLSTAHDGNVVSTQVEFSVNAFISSFLARIQSCLSTPLSASIRFFGSS
jgi:hypothetical protein